ncbi:hypothetical protein KP806_21090 [Paenibacillus sp. N4]|uniref:hypothetical protein n=1 Tax=Paenibacillus vietnamensis TaxID=2590547 RepID=UPI001CD097F6|nr:hypothetical protein [Paenibacillus vietnamensis]MCA0757561.1 hypothetical protein [Paenibacillus vietnamensis]
MQQHLQRLVQLSSELVRNLDGCGMEEIEAYMEERGRIFVRLKQFTPDSASAHQNRELVASMIQMDRVITGRMMNLRDEANRELNKLSRSKRTKAMYDSGPYGDESLFFDTKR